MELNTAGPSALPSPLALPRPSPSPTQSRTNRSAPPSPSLSYLRPSLPPSPGSSVFSLSLSDADYASIAPHGPDAEVIASESARLRPRISHARKASQSSGRLLHLGSVYSLNGERGGSSSSTGAGAGVRRELGTSGDDAGGWTLQAGGSTELSHDSMTPLSPETLAGLRFPAPPARPSVSPVPSAFHRLSNGEYPTILPSAPPLPPKPTISYHAHTLSQSSDATSCPTLHLYPHSPALTSTSARASNRFSAMTILTPSSPSRDHTFGIPTRPPVPAISPITETHSETGRLSVYDPLGGGPSDNASYGSESLRWAGTTSEVSPKSFQSFGARGPVTVKPDTEIAQKPSKLGQTARSRSTKSAKSTKSGKSAKSGRSGRSKSAKRGSATSLAYRSAELSWTLRPTSPWEDREEEGLLDGDGVAEGVSAKQDDALGPKKRRKSMRTIRREEQDLDLGRLLGRAAVLEKILNAGKRASNQSIRFRPMRAGSPLNLPPLPPMPTLHHRPSSMTSTKTIDTSATHVSASTASYSMHNAPPVPHLSSMPRRVSLSQSFSSSIGQARRRLGKRIKRNGEWGGEGYTSLPGSEAGSRVQICRSSEGTDREGLEGGGVVLLASPVDESPPVPPKPAHLRRSRMGGRRIVEGDLPAGCLPHGPSEILLPPSCIPVGVNSPPEVYHSLRSSRGFGSERMDHDIDQTAIQAYSYVVRRTNEEDEKVVNYRLVSPPNLDEASRARKSVRRGSKVLSYVSTGQASLTSRRRWIIWIGMGCVVGLAVVSAILASVLSRR